MFISSFGYFSVFEKLFSEEIEKREKNTIKLWINMKTMKHTKTKLPTSPQIQWQWHRSAFGWIDRTCYRLQIEYNLIHYLMRKHSTTFTSSQAQLSANKPPSPSPNRMYQWNWEEWNIQTTDVSKCISENRTRKML